MAEMARAEALVQMMERDAALRSAVEAAPTVDAKRGVLEAHGFGDVSMDDMHAYARKQGRTHPDAGRGGRTE